MEKNMKPIKLKSKAKEFVCQTKIQASEAITQVGDAQREILRLETEINDITARALEERQERINKLQKAIEVLSEGVQGYCEANRDVLCKNSKTANLTTGEVSWRMRPRKVVLRKVDAVLKELKLNKLKKLIRSKEEVNKEAILANPALVKNIKGISIKSGIEDFVIKPFEIDISD